MATMPAVAGSAVMPAMTMAVGLGGGGRGGEAGGDKRGGGHDGEQTHPDILLLMVAGCSPSETIDTPFGAICP